MKNFEQEYINSVDASAPDMDKLWERIASAEDSDGHRDITPFLAASEECARASQKRRSGIIRSFTAAAAVFGAVICAVMAVSDSGIAYKGNTASEGAAMNGICADRADNADCDTDSPAGEIISVLGWDYSEELSVYEGISYSSLNLADTAGATYTALSGNREDEEYFVEQKVLSETEFFLDGRVISARADETNGAVYTLEVVHAVCGGERSFPARVEVYSFSPYALRENREYLLPIREEGGRYRVIFDNAPQIEFTENRELVCHNGWKSLADNSEPLIYPQTWEDDYFYDRMNITAEASLEKLFGEWLSRKE